MAAAVSGRAMAQQPLHPFFTNRQRVTTTETQVDSDVKDDSISPEREVHPRLSPDDDVDEAGDMEEDPNHERRKRRKTTPLPEESRDPLPAPIPTTDPQSSVNRCELEQETREAGKDEPSIPSMQHLDTSEAPHLGSPENRPQESRARTPQGKRILRLRADGKLKSPGTTEQTEETKTRRKQKRQSRKGRGITIKYGRTPHDRLALGKRIEQIISGKLRVGPLAQETTAEVSVKSGGKATTKDPASEIRKRSTHPFFLGQQKRQKVDVPAETASCDESVLADNSGEDKATKPSSQPLKSRWPASFGASFSKPLKILGSIEAAWPPRDMQHVRGVLSSYLPAYTTWEQAASLTRKLKGKENFISPNDEIYQPQQALVARVRDLQRSDDTTSHFEAKVGVSNKLLISGIELQSRLRSRLEGHRRNMTVPMTSVTNAPTAIKLQFLSYAAEKLFHRVTTSLSAFDTFEGDNQDWSHKYAPKRVDEVLQDQVELSILRDWIHSMNVDQVDVGSTASSGKLDIKKQLAAKRRKRKLKDELDDFIVSSESEAPDADELSEPEDADQVTTFGGSNISASTLKKLKPSIFKKTRAVLLSGPSGCGKTAAVYAAASELGFEVFEINPGARRNGRDIMDRVGDMTKNHLVRNSDHTEQTIEESLPPIDLEIDEKQQSVASFFKAKPSVANQKSQNAGNKNAAARSKSQPATASKPKKQQKQSLILLEEVDVLFEEDKPFWSAVFSLIVQSRRPIIMTCSDERCLPHPEFVDTAVLRFAPPAPSTISEYLMCLAANEGHLLNRSEVDQLVSLRSGDMRASIQDLQLWCQMAVGDNRNGISWFMDASSANRKRSKDQVRLRVVSESTFKTNSTVFDRKQNRSRDIEYDSRLLNEADSIYEYDIFEDMDSVLGLAKVDGGPFTKLETLKNIDACYDALSSADTWPFSPADHDALDPTQPCMTEKTRGSYVDDFKLLQTDAKEDLSELGSRISFAVRASSHYLLAGHKHVKRKNLFTQVLSRKPSMASSQSQTRSQLRQRFEPLSEADEGTPWNPSKGPGISALNGPIGMLAAEVVPTIRAIALFDLELAEERERLSELTSVPGRDNKRHRKTRAARAALEGGSKASTRREKWWHRDVDYKGILRTVKPSWIELGLDGLRVAKLQNSVEDDVEMQDGGRDSNFDTPSGSADESKDESTMQHEVKTVIEACQREEN